MTSVQNNLVSVCIPVYNGAELIGETIESVLSQTYKTLEIIVLDNNSQDETNTIVSQYAQHDERIKLYKNVETVEMGDNWNHCVNYATGDYIMLLSADDILMPKFVETAIATFYQNDIDAFSSNHILFNNQRERQRRITLKEKIYQKYTSLILLKNPFSINFTLFTKDAIEQMKLLNNNNLFKSYYTCDYDLWIRSSTYLKIYFSNTILGKYRLHDSNLSKNKERMLNETLQVLLDNKDYLKSHSLVSYMLTRFRLFIRSLFL